MECTQRNAVLTALCAHWTPQGPEVRLHFLSISNPCWLAEEGSQSLNVFLHLCVHAFIRRKQWFQACVGQWGWCDHRPPPSPASEPHHTHAHTCTQVSVRACVHAHTCGGGPHSCPAFLVQLQHPCRLPGPACLHVASEGLCMRRAGWGPPVKQVVQAPWAMLRASYTCVRGQNKLPQSSAALSFARLGRMATHVSLAV